MNHTLTLYHNSASLPMGEPVTLDNDPSWLLGKCDVAAGSVKMWRVPNSEIRIVLFIDTPVTVDYIDDSIN